MVRSPLALFVSLLALAPALAEAQSARKGFQLDPISLEIRNYETPLRRPQLAEASSLIRVHEAREDFDVDGSGRVAVVLDTGANRIHVDFNGKLVAGVNYTPDNAGDVTDYADGQGHGTNVAGVIAANGLHLGIAPEADLIVMKVLDDSGGGSFDWTRDALRWTLDHLDEYEISVVNMSLGDSSNESSDESIPNGVLDEIRDLIGELRDRDVAVCIAAGNDFWENGAQEGMGFPAICRESISVGALYDSDEGPFLYFGAEAFSTGPNRLTPFSQRVHSSTNAECRTDIFAPGAPMTSTGIGTGTSESETHGTSQACPVVAGAVLLMQEYVLRETGELPTVDQLEGWLRGGVTVKDGDDEDDNVRNTNKSYVALDVYKSLEKIDLELRTRRTEYRGLGYAAYVQAYYAQVAASYAYAVADGFDFVPYADYHAGQALSHADDAGWNFSFATATRDSDFVVYEVPRTRQYLASYYAYFYATYDWYYENNPYSYYASQASFYAYAYGYYDSID